MSQPKRYRPALEPGRGSNFNGFEVSMREDEKADWVSYSDYAALAAENERLRKAGDRLVAAQGKFDEEDDAADAWNAAKEGGDK